jgi:DHA2 family multidrug resistance protein
MIQVYQMVALPFLFIPINTIAYEQLPPDKNNQGSALIKCCPQPRRQALLQRSQFHQARLVSNVVPSSPAWQSALQGLTHYFTARGASPSSAQSRAIAYVGQMIDGQATLMADIDVFHIWAVFPALLVPGVLLLIGRVSGGSRTAAH